MYGGTSSTLLQLRSAKKRLVLRDSSPLRPLAYEYDNTMLKSSLAVVYEEKKLNDLSFFLFLGDNILFLSDVTRNS